MPQYDNRNSGVLFENRDKKEETHPDLKGRVTLNDGNEYWLNAWHNEVKSGPKQGLKYIKVSIGNKIEPPEDEVPF